MTVTLFREYGEWTPVIDVAGPNLAAQQEFLDLWEEENNRLRRLFSPAPNDILATQRRDGKLRVRVQGIAGTLPVGTRQFRVVPKCLTLDTQDWERILVRMVAFAESLHFDVTAPIDVADEPTTFVDHIAYAFALSLEQALLSGPLLFYQEQEIYSPYVRGQLLLEPITDLITRPQTLRCTVDEMNLDNPYTALLSWALETLLRATRKPVIRLRLEHLRPAFAGIVPQHLAPGSVDRLSLPPQYLRYGQAIEIARYLARAETSGQDTGDRPAGGLVLDMARVFERFVGALLRVVAQRRGITSYAQQSDLLAREVGGEGRSYWPRPDDRLIGPDGLLLLVDSKYKGRSGQEAANYLLIDVDDLYQAIVSTLASGCPHVLLVYPATDQTSVPGKRPSYRQWRVTNRLGRDVLVTAIALDLHDLAVQGEAGLIDTLNDGVTQAMT